MRGHPFTHVGIVACGGWCPLRQPSVGPCQTIAAHASDLQDALLHVSMPAIAGLALRRPKATPATRLTVDFGAVGIGLCQG